MTKPSIDGRTGEWTPPERPVLPAAWDRNAWDQNGLMWIWTGVRRRAYICTLGVIHKHYWRTHWQQGRNDFVACEHEVTYG